MKVVISVLLLLALDMGKARGFGEGTTALEENGIDFTAVIEQVEEKVGDLEIVELFRGVFEGKDQNPLTQNHSHHFQNAKGAFGRIYKIGVDDYTIPYTPTGLSYEAFSAVGFGLANSIVVKNDNGFILIDAGENSEQVTEMIDAFVEEEVLEVNKETGFLYPPLKAIIYTHNHIDHTGGAWEWLRRSGIPACDQNNDGVDGDYVADRDCVEVISHYKVPDAIVNTATRTGQIINSRSAYMYGTFLTPEVKMNNGIGPPIKLGTNTYQPPSKTFMDTMLVVLPSMKMKLHLKHIPSETSDEIMTFIPDCANRAEEGGSSSADKGGSLRGGPFETEGSGSPKVCNITFNTPPQMLGKGFLQSAEAVQGPAFPNLYSLRGTTFRNPLTWYESIDILRKYEAWTMVPSHGVPLMGYDNIQTLLVNFRDGIAHVHDQSLRYIRAGYIPDEIVELVDLPAYVLENLETITDGLPVTETARMHPRDYMRTFYGSVPQGIRELYCGYLGWNTGDPTLFKPLPPVERAGRYVQLMGGPAAVIAEAQAAYELGKASGDKQEFQWAAELLINVIRASITSDLERNIARVLKAKAFIKLASTDETDVPDLEADWFSLNPNWRNWYLTGAIELLLTSTESRFPNSKVNLISSEIQAGISDPGYWVQHWSWRFNSKSAALDGTKVGWKFLPNTTFWSDEPLFYIQHVDKEVVRYISDPIEVERKWWYLDIAIEIDHSTFLELIRQDQAYGGFDPPSVDYNADPDRFAKALFDMINSGDITLLRGTAEGAKNFYLSEHFDALPSTSPIVVGR